jgi:hypothetical protein
VKRILSIACICLALAACASRPPADRIALPAAPPPGEPAATSGMTAQALKIAYGAPAFARVDGDTQLWRYDGTACHAFFFLYPDKGTLTVRHVETLPRPADAAADPACLNALRRQPLPTS